nr:mucin-5B-like [Crassostrea gigas]
MTAGPPTATMTARPATATMTTRIPTATMTAGPPTATMTAGPPTATMTTGPPTATMTAGPPTATMTAGPPTATMTAGPPSATMTAGPPTATMTAGAHIATMTAGPPTATMTAGPPTATMTAGPPTATMTTRIPTGTMTSRAHIATMTAGPPTATMTAGPPTATMTAGPPTATMTTRIPTGTMTSRAPAAAMTVGPLTAAVTAGPPTATLTLGLLASESGDICLPAGWKQTLPKADHLWVSKALFRFSPGGRVEFDLDKIDRVWFYPPQPSLSCTIKPRVDRYFSRPLFLWMPRRLWLVKLYCPQQGCNRVELTSVGIYNKVRQVLDVNGYYTIAGETLICPACKKRMVSWNQKIIQQLDLGHQLQFPCILTYRYACDLKIIRLLRQRGIGNSASQIRAKIQEQHSEVWLQKCIQYMTDMPRVFTCSCNWTYLAAKT